MKRLSTPEHCVDKRENAVLWNCSSLHQAMLAAIFLYICSMFSIFVHYLLFSIFVHYFIFSIFVHYIFYICALFSILFHIFVHFFIFVCIMNCWSLHPATPATDCGHICSIFFLIFVHYFFVFFPHILYLIIIFYICLYLELLVVASSNACSRLWMIAGTTHFWRTSFCPSSVSSICFSDFKHSSAYWQCCSGVKMFQDLSAAEQQFFLRAVVIVQEDADGILQKRPNCS